MNAERQLQELPPKQISNPKNKNKKADVLFQYLAGTWFTFIELDGNIYYQASPTPILN
jgi:hypothetical protein